jgi:hypothetical protein
LDTSSCKDCNFHIGTDSRFCVVDEYMSTQCSSGSDVSDVSSCKGCNVNSNTCPYNQLTVQCSFQSTTDVSTCLACPPVDPGFYFVSPGCQSGECTSGDGLTCSTDQKKVGCDGTGVVDDIICSAADFTCDNLCSGDNYETVACDYSSIPAQQRVCNQCDTCTALQYESVPCTPNLNRICLGCSPSQVCPPESIWVPCSSKADGHCKLCVLPVCGDGKYGAGCYGTEDYVCVDCTPRSCSLGQYERTCGNFVDSECLDCDESCIGGSYEVSPCTSDSNRVCETCTDCTSSQYAATECANGMNRVCSACSTPCGFGTWEETDCSQTEDRYCEQCSECNGDAGGIQQACTDKSDTVCNNQIYIPSSCGTGQYMNKLSNTCMECLAPCSSGSSWQAPNGYFQEITCTIYHDRSCTPCMTTCPLDTYQVAACDENNDIICYGCNVAPCEAGTYQSAGCGGQRDRVCSACHAPCKASIEYEFQECTPFQNRVCKTCSTCPEGYFRPDDSECDGVYLDGCQLCSTGTCSAGEYQVGVCSPRENNECKSCTTSFCGDGKWKFADCSEFEDRKCKNCDIGICMPGSYESSECKDDMNHVCSICGTCEEGVSYASPNTCHGSTNTVCSPCSTCNNGYYISTQCSITNDVICSICAPACESGYYESQGCTADHDRVCSQCSTTECGPNTYYYSPCGTTSDRVCAFCSSTCAIGTFETRACTANIDHECTECSPCSSGSYRNGGCSGNLDTVCATCRIKCSLGMTITQPCSPDADATCTMVDTGNIQTLMYNLNFNMYNPYNDNETHIDALHRSSPGKWHNENKKYSPYVHLKTLRDRKRIHPTTWYTS